MNFHFLQPKLSTGSLLLSDGTIFHGYSFGYEGAQLSNGVLGEVVFNTAMMGYQEILTDPSYHGQIVIMTYTMIGNYGINTEDMESGKPFASGFIVHEFSEADSNWRAKYSLREYLRQHRIPALCGIDTRAITRYIRDKGAMNGYILSPSPDVAEVKKIFERLKQEPAFGDRDLVAEVSCEEIFEWKDPADEFHSQWRSQPLELRKDKPLVIVLDMGCKWNSLRSFTSRGCRVMVVPVNTSVEKILSLKPAGLFLSNGPGDPKKVAHAAETTKKLLGKIPIFGICMGQQILAEAIGAKTYKMKFGHHGGNQPVLDIKSGRVMITSQNHGYSVDEKSLPSFAHVSQINLNDKSVEGIFLPEYKAFSVQYHPEACPGPHDAESHFDEFVNLLN